MVIQLLLQFFLCLKIAVFWDMTPYSLVETCRHSDNLVTPNCILNRRHEKIKSHFYILFYQIHFVWDDTIDSKTRIRVHVTYHLYAHS
jgi:hypothetical protein